LHNDVDRVKATTDQLNPRLKSLREKIDGLKKLSDPSDEVAVWLNIDEVDAAAREVEKQAGEVQNQVNQFKSSFDTWGQQLATAPTVTGANAAKNEARQEQEELTVYVTNTGSKYHRAGCSYLARSSNPMSKKDAIAAGYTPCSRCNP
jgi:hypothetical protein